jgi:hypothetical protein
VYGVRQAGQVNRMGMGTPLGQVGDGGGPSAPLKSMLD